MTGRSSFSMKMASAQDWLAIMRSIKCGPSNGVSVVWPKRADDLAHAGFECRDGERLLQDRPRIGVLAHSLIEARQEFRVGE
jgi:hypothetical protein